MNSDGAAISLLQVQRISTCVSKGTFVSLVLLMPLDTHKYALLININTYWLQMTFSLEKEVGSNLSGVHKDFLSL